MSTQKRYETEKAISWLEGQGLRYEYEERAAILEYDDELSRNEAEAQALIDIRQRKRGTVS